MSIAITIAKFIGALHGSGILYSKLDERESVFYFIRKYWPFCILVLYIPIYPPISQTLGHHELYPCLVQGSFLFSCLSFSSNPHLETNIHFILLLLWSDNNKKKNKNASMQQAFYYQQFVSATRKKEVITIFTTQRSRKGNRQFPFAL